jgi:uncharacterized membrane protein YvbJ
MFLVRKCGNCGHNVEDDKAVQCPYCSRLLGQLAIKKRLLSAIGNILTTIGALGKMASGLIVLCLLLYLLYLWLMFSFSHAS